MGQQALKDDEAKFKFVFYGGAMHKVRIDGATGAANKKKAASKPMDFEGSIDVPKNLVGKLIGKGGSTIKEICTSTHAFVDIPKDQRGEVVQVTVKGSKQAVDAAVQRISDLLVA